MVLLHVRLLGQASVSALHSHTPPWHAEMLGSRQWAPPEPRQQPSPGAQSSVLSQSNAVYGAGHRLLPSVLSLHVPPCVVL